MMSLRLIGFPSMKPAAIAVSRLFFGARRQGHQGQGQGVCTFSISTNPATQMTPADKILGGAAVFERVTYFLSSELDSVQHRHFPGPRRSSSTPRRCAQGEASGATSNGVNGRSSLRRSSASSQRRTIPVSFSSPPLSRKPTACTGRRQCGGLHTEEICGRFDIFLKRRYAAGDAQRGLLVFAEGRFHQRARLWVRGFRELGTQWNVLRNLSDIPYFASTSETRLLQIADIVSSEPSAFDGADPESHLLRGGFPMSYCVAQGLQGRSGAAPGRARRCPCDQGRAD